LDLNKLAEDIRNFEGVTRKKPISNIVEIFEQVHLEYSDSIVDFGDDAAIIDIGGEDVILFAADGIWSRLLKNPWWAGYSSVVVNVADIAAMGGRPISMVNVLSSNNLDGCNGILSGIRDGVAKFGVPMVGGHMHPDTPYISLAVAIIGIAKKDCVIRSDTAKPGDSIIVCYDLDGRIGPNSIYSWDTTSMKSPKNVREKYQIMQKIALEKLATAGKDISNPGTIGTLGMLLETSKVGAEIDLTKILRPNKTNIDFAHWLKVFPASGFIVTTESKNSFRVIELFESVGLSASVVGEITNHRLLEICNGDERAIVFDFRKDSITGIVSNTNKKGGL